MRSGPIRLAVTLAVVAGVLAACSSSSGGGDDLAGRTFEGDEVEGRTLVEGSIVRIAFDTTTISVTAGCNTIFGDMSWDDGTLTTDAELASTMMGCEDDLVNQDTWLRDLLMSSPPYTLDGETLTIGEDGERLTLTEIEVEE
jgi:heat shock protein HslJ